jgi:hypothetical protein
MRHAALVTPQEGDTSLGDIHALAAIRCSDLLFSKTSRAMGKSPKIPALRTLKVLGSVLGTRQLSKYEVSLLINMVAGTSKADPHLTQMQREIHGCISDHIPCGYRCFVKTSEGKLERDLIAYDDEGVLMPLEPEQQPASLKQMSAHAVRRAIIISGNPEESVALLHTHEALQNFVRGAQSQKMRDLESLLYGAFEELDALREKVLLWQAMEDYKFFHGYFVAEFPEAGVSREQHVQRHMPKAKIHVQKLIKADDKTKLFLLRYAAKDTYEWTVKHENILRASHELAAMGLFSLILPSIDKLPPYLSIVAALIERYDNYDKPISDLRRLETLKDIVANTNRGDKNLTQLQHDVYDMLMPCGEYTVADRPDLVYWWGELQSYVKNEERDTSIISEAQRYTGYTGGHVEKQPTLAHVLRRAADEFEQVIEGPEPKLSSATAAGARRAANCIASGI